MCFHTSLYPGPVLGLFRGGAYASNDSSKNGKFRASLLHGHGGGKKVYLSIIFFSFSKSKTGRAVTSRTSHFSWEHLMSRDGFSGPFLSSKKNIFHARLHQEFWTFSSNGGKKINSSVKNSVHYIQPGKEVGKNNDCLLEYFTLTRVAVLVSTGRSF